MKTSTLVVPLAESVSPGNNPPDAGAKPAGSDPGATLKTGGPQHLLAGPQ
jgi:hypothetical protein